VVDLRSTYSSDGRKFGGAPESTRGPRRRSKGRENAAFAERQGLEKIWVAALASLFSDLVSDVRVENEREVGGYI